MKKSCHNCKHSGSIHLWCDLGHWGIDKNSENIKYLMAKDCNDYEESVKRL